MYNLLKSIKFIFELLRCFPHLIIFLIHKNKPMISADIIRWREVLGKHFTIPVGLIYLLAFHKEFRNLFYFRIGTLKYLLNIFCPGLSSLFIESDQKIGEGFFIWHGFATGINSNSIGKNCTINQQVSIGNFKGYPTILDNVTIYAGAVIIGNITIGNNAVIGANSTVFRDVPDNCTVYPPSPNIMKWNRSRNSCSEKLSSE